MFDMSRQGDEVLREEEEELSDQHSRGKSGALNQEGSASEVNIFIELTPSLSTRPQERIYCVGAEIALSVYQTLSCTSTWLNMQSLAHSVETYRAD